MERHRLSEAIELRLHPERVAEVVVARLDVRGPELLTMLGAWHDRLSASGWSRWIVQWHDAEPLDPDLRDEFVGCYFGRLKRRMPPIALAVVTQNDTFARFAGNFAALAPGATHVFESEDPAWRWISSRA